MNKKLNKVTASVLSNHSSQAEWELSYWQKIINSKEILPKIITPYERRHLVRRAAVIELLQAGKSYREIGRELWLSPQTISVIKKSLHESGYRSYLERSKKERKRRIYSSSEKDQSTPKRRIYRRTKYGAI